MRKYLLLITSLLISSIALSQNKIAGKWKPVYLTMDRFITADIKADTIYISDTINVMVKGDADPEASKELMKMMVQLMLDKMKNTEQEFVATGEYIEYNKRRNTSRKGTYTFEATTNILTTNIAGKAEEFVVSFKNDHLVLTGKLDNGKGDKGVLMMEYEKL